MQTFMRNHAQSSVSGSPAPNHVDGITPNYFDTDSQGRELALAAAPDPPAGSGTLIPSLGDYQLSLPPVLAGSVTPEIRLRVEQFYSGVAELFERWVHRPKSVHTRRSYRDGVLSFVRHRGLVWPREASALLLVSVGEVQQYRDALAAAGAAPPGQKRSALIPDTHFRLNRSHGCYSGINELVPRFRSQLSPRQQK